MTQPLRAVLLPRDELPPYLEDKAVDLVAILISDDESSDVLDSLAGKSRLSRDDRLLVTLLAKGKTATFAAKSLAVSPRTIYRRLDRLKSRYGVASTNELIAHLTSDARLDDRFVSSDVAGGPSNSPNRSS